MEPNEQENKLVVIRHFTIFVTATNTDCATPMIMGLIGRGYTVSAALDNGALAHGKAGDSSYLIMIYASHKRDGITSNEVHSHMMEIIEAEKIGIYSMIVSEKVSATITGNNMGEQDPVQKLIQHILVTPSDPKKSN